jgi:hypothetical protein
VSPRGDQILCGREITALINVNELNELTVLNMIYTIACL